MFHTQFKTGLCMLKFYSQYRFVEDRKRLGNLQTLNESRLKDLLCT